MNNRIQTDLPLKNNLYFIKIEYIDKIAIMFLAMICLKNGKIATFVF